MKKRLLNATVKQSFWTLADQCVVSLGSFLTNILLARSLPPAEYGAYVLIFGIVVFLNTLHGSLLTYPLAVKGAAADENGLRRFATGSVLLTIVLVLPLSVGVVGAAWAVGKLWLTPWVFGALLLGQVQETIRRAMMAHLRHREALWGDMLSYLGQAGFVWLVSQSGRLSLEAVFGVMALTSGVAAAMQAVQLGLWYVAFNEVCVFAKSYWQLGRWMLLNYLASFFTDQAAPWILAFFHGLEQAAALQAVNNLVAVSNPVMFSVFNLIVPAAARVRIEGGVRSAWRVSLGYATQGGVLLLPYYATLLLWPHQTLELFYGSGSPYLKLDTPLRLFVLSYILYFVYGTLGAYLNSLEKSQFTFLSQLFSTLCALTVGLPLAAWGGVVGASGGRVLSVLAGLFANVFFLRKVRS